MFRYIGYIRVQRCIWAWKNRTFEFVLHVEVLTGIRYIGVLLYSMNSQILDPIIIDPIVYFDKNLILVYIKFIFGSDIIWKRFVVRKCGVYDTLTWSLWHWLSAHRSWKAIHFFSTTLRNGRVLIRSYKLSFTYWRNSRAALSDSCNYNIISDRFKIQYNSWQL